MTAAAIGGIGSALAGISEEPTRVQCEAAKIVKVLAIGGGLLSAAIINTNSSTGAALGA